jgi:uncharacterized membrane protein YcaP (DUF421 family)
VLARFRLRRRLCAGDGTQADQQQESEHASHGPDHIRKLARAPSLSHHESMFHIFRPETSIALLVVRAVIVYAFLMVGLRLAGRRETGQMTSFDLVLLLVLSNAVQNSINAGDNSLSGGLISAVTLLVLNAFVGFAAYRWRWFERLVEGRPVRMITDGKVHMKALARERITVEQLRSALRKQGIDGISYCKRAVLEPDGTLSAVRKGVEVHRVEEITHPDDEGDVEVHP